MGQQEHTAGEHFLDAESKDISVDYCVVLVFRSAVHLSRCWLQLPEQYGHQSCKHSDSLSFIFFSISSTINTRFAIGNKYAKREQNGSPRS